MAYDVIFFDLDHTLVDTKKQYELGLDMTIEQVYGESAPDEFASLYYSYNQQLWPEYDARRIDMATLRRERFIRAWRHLGVEKSVDEADQFYEVYSATFDKTLFTYPGTIDLLEALEKQHKFGIITNGTPDLQWRKMQISGLDRFFQEAHVIISEKIGMAKPHPSVYTAACNQLRVNLKHALMIGDNYRADVSGARNFGMDAIWFAPDLNYVSKENTTGEQPIRDWEELLRAIEKLEKQR